MYGNSTGVLAQVKQIIAATNNALLDEEFKRNWVTAKAETAKIHFIGLKFNLEASYSN